MEYLKGEEGYKVISKKNKIASSTTLRKWVAAYKEFGDKGLERARENKNYAFEYKVHVVELYLTTEASYQEVAIKEGINNPSMVARWVNDYRIAGPDALRPKRKGRKITMSKSSRQTVLQKEKSKSDIEKYLRQMEEENLKLRIENAYLKELRRLRLKYETKNGKRV